jgi:hypothetical protein
MLISSMCFPIRLYSPFAQALRSGVQQGPSVVTRRIATEAAKASSDRMAMLPQTLGIAGRVLGEGFELPLDI